MIYVSNESDFGLQASIFTENINQAITIAKKLEVGSVNINGKSQRSPDSFPFLGIKNSGLGVQGIKNSLLSLVRPKGIIINYYFFLIHNLFYFNKEVLFQNYYNLWWV